MIASNNLRQVLQVLRGKRFPLEDEKQTQNAIAAALENSLDLWEREVRIAGGIIDFVACGNVGVEVKLKGRPVEIRKQIERYAAEPRLESLVLVTAKPVDVGFAIGGKRIVVVDLGRAWL